MIEDKNQIITNLKNNTFIKHIEEHLKSMPEVKDKRVYCRICGKNIDQIFDEKLLELSKKINRRKD
jgi:hypothetical protein